MKNDSSSSRLLDRSKLRCVWIWEESESRKNKSKGKYRNGGATIESIG